MTAKKVRVEDVEPDPSLSAEQGWVDMKVRWLVNEDSFNSALTTLGYTVFPPGRSQHRPHVHENAEEIIIVMRGRALHRIGDEEMILNEGDITFVPRGVVHSTANASDTEPLELFFIYGGAPSLEKSGYKVV